MSQTLRDVMTTNVVSVSPQQTVQEAARLMKEHNVGSLPVVENGQLKGIITDRDITVRATAQGKEDETLVAEVMTSSTVEASPDMDVHQAAQLMAQHQIRRLPVVENNRLVGMVALGDLATREIYQDEAQEALSDISSPSEPRF